MSYLISITRRVIIQVLPSRDHLEKSCIRAPKVLSIYGSTFIYNLNNLLITYMIYSTLFRRRSITLFKSVIVAISMAVLLSACSSSPSDPSVAQKEQSELLERCRQLQKDIEDLKGRPVRRSAAREYYASECTNRVQPFPSGVN